MIYESERAGFMADHKSVSAQLTLGNFPTPLSNLTPLPRAAASMGDPPRALGRPQRQPAQAGPATPLGPGGCKEKGPTYWMKSGPKIPRIEVAARIVEGEPKGLGSLPGRAQLYRGWGSGSEGGGKVPQFPFEGTPAFPFPLVDL